VVQPFGTPIAQVVWPCWLTIWFVGSAFTCVIGIKIPIVPTAAAIIVAIMANDFVVFNMFSTAVGEKYKDYALYKKFLLKPAQIQEIPLCIVPFTGIF
jgi:hypothetical protein